MFEDVVDELVVHGVEGLERSHRVRSGHGILTESYTTKMELTDGESLIW